MSKLAYQKEEWKDIQNYEGYYIVSNTGRIKSLDRIEKINGWQRIKRGKELIPYNCGAGYLVVCLAKNGYKRKFYIHRIVAETFIPNINNKKEVDHIDTIVTNNRIDNLRWVTRSENHLNPITRERRREVAKHIKKASGANHHRSRPIYQYTLKGVFIKNWESSIQIEQSMNISRRCVLDCCRGKYEKSHGYIWRYEK